MNDLKQPVTATRTEVAEAIRLLWAETSLSMDLKHEQHREYPEECTKSFHAHQQAWRAVRAFPNQPLIRAIRGLEALGCETQRGVGIDRWVQWANEQWNTGIVLTA